jgi:hypothetical protein
MEAPALSSSFGSTHTGNQSVGDRSTCGHNAGSHGTRQPAGQPTGLGLVSDGWQAHNRPILPKGMPMGRAETTDSDSDLDHSAPLLFEEDAGDRADDEHTAHETSSPQSRTSTTPAHKQRRSLPNKAPRSRKVAQRKKTPELALKAEPTLEQSSAPRQKKARVTRKVLDTPKTENPKTASPKTTSPKMVGPKTANPKSAKSPKTSLSKAREAQEAQEDEEAPIRPTISPLSSRSEKDEFLLASKQKGMSYREIRAAGRFTEAESTLRGRYRTLTKSKEERVRKPEWSEKDVSASYRTMWSETRR